MDARSVAAIVAARPFEAERRIAWLRLLVVGHGSLTYVALMDHARTMPALVYPLIVISWAYSLWMYRVEPYRRWRFLVSGYFTAIADTVFIVLWLIGTGGDRSPFFLTLYLSVFAVAFRYSTREAIVASALSAGAYLAVLAGAGVLFADLAGTTTRVAYIFFAAIMGSMMLRQVLDQAHATAEALEREKATKADAIEGEQRARFLAEASSVLASSLDFETTLKNVARLVVPTLGDNCVVDLRDDAGVVRRVAEAAANEEDEETLRKLRPFAEDTEVGPVREAMRSSVSVIVPVFGEAEIQRLGKGRDPEYVELVRKIGARWSVTVPLVVHGRAFGAMTFGRSRADAPYNERDKRVAEELALRAAIAIEHARLYRDAQEAIRTRDEFLSIASHELRTPLNVMQLQTDGLLRQARREGDDRLLAPLERSKRQVHRLSTLVESLLDVSRVTAGRMNLELADVDISAAILEVAVRMRDEATRAGSTLDVQAADGLFGRVDRLRLDQIATNLVSNAIKYGAGKPVRVAVERHGDAARIRVSDEGIGISDEDQARIFERFERAVSVRHYGGFGLGLWIVRQIVEAHGGRIAIQSRLGEGSTFEVQLPLAGPAPPSS
jgi:signal transduction histidine kinase